MVCLRINGLFSRMHAKNVKKHGEFGSFTHRYIIFSTWNVQRLFTLSCHLPLHHHGIDTQKPSVSAPIPVSLLTAATSAALPPASLYPWVKGHERMRRPSGLSEMELSYADGKRDPSHHEGVSAKGAITCSGSARPPFSYGDVQQGNNI